MKKNIFALPLLLAASLSLNGIKNPDNTNFDFEDQTPVFQELLFGNKPTQSISAKPAPAVTPPVTVSKPQVVTPPTPALEVAKPIITEPTIVAPAKESDLDHERKLEELKNAANQAYANAHRADAISAYSAWLAIPSFATTAGLYFLTDNQIATALAAAAGCACVASAWYFKKKTSFYGQEAQIVLEEYYRLQNSPR